MGYGAYLRPELRLVGSLAVVVFTNNDSAYRTAIDLAHAGIGVVAVVDARDDPPPGLGKRVADLGIEVLSAAVVTRALGRRHVKGVEVAALSLDGARVSGPVSRIACDLVCVSGGWTPSVQLQSQSGVNPVYRDDLTTFVPGEPGPGQRSAGACLGLGSTEACLASGQDAGAPFRLSTSITRASTWPILANSSTGRAAPLRRNGQRPVASNSMPGRLRP